MLKPKVSNAVAVFGCLRGRVQDSGMVFDFVFITASLIHMPSRRAAHCILVVGLHENLGLSPQAPIWSLDPASNVICSRMSKLILKLRCGRALNSSSQLSDHRRRFYRRHGNTGGLRVRPSDQDSPILVFLVNLSSQSVVYIYMSVFFVRV